MRKDEPSVIGTVALQENNNISTSSPWETVTLSNLPYSVLSQPPNFMFAHGSACGSAPTTSLEGHTYVSDLYVFRRDKNGVDVDRYLGSITPTNTLAILKIPNPQIQFHHLKPTDPIISHLPMQDQKQLRSILGIQTP